MTKSVPNMTSLAMLILTRALAGETSAAASEDLKISLIPSLAAAEADRRRDPNAPRQGADLQYTMTLKFEEAVFGKETDIEIPREETCDTCDGSGAKPGTKWIHVNTATEPAS